MGLVVAECDRIGSKFLADALKSPRLLWEAKLAGRRMLHAQDMAVEGESSPLSWNADPSQLFTERAERRGNPLWIGRRLRPKDETGRFVRTLLLPYCMRSLGMTRVRNLAKIRWHAP